VGATDAGYDAGRVFAVRDRRRFVTKKEFSMICVRNLVGAGALALLLLADSVAAQHEHQHGTKPPERLGTVQFDTTCQPAVTADFNRGVALLHSFWFGAASDTFTKVAAADSSCAMAFWGVAMSHWGNPFGSYRSPAGLADGRQALAKATDAGTGA
jgi:hypothetical protein